jgi:hypothetical protein
VRERAGRVVPDASFATAQGRLGAMVGPRVYTVEQANEQVPQLTRIFDAADEIRARMKEAKLRLNALEVIWGAKVEDPSCTDHTEYAHYKKEMESLRESFERTLQRVAELGAVVKGLDPGLVDFYGVRDGHLVFLCWERGEEGITHWHHIDSNYAGRQPL